MANLGDSGQPYGTRHLAGTIHWYSYDLATGSIVWSLRREHMSVARDHGGWGTKKVKRIDMSLKRLLLESEHQITSSSAPLRQTKTSLIFLITLELSPAPIPLGRFFLMELAHLILHPKDKTLNWTYWLKNNPRSAPFWACLAGCCF